jgi:hypothetical protein
LPAERTLGSQVPSQSRCCTLPTPTPAASIHRRTSMAGATRARCIALGVDHARTHCRHARVHVRTHTWSHAECRSYIGTPSASLMHSRTQRPTSAPHPPLPHAPPSARVTHARTACRHARVHRAHSQVRGPNPRVVHPPSPRSHAKTYAPPPRRALCPCTAVSPLRGCLAAPLYAAARRQPGASEVATPSSTPPVPHSLLSLESSLECRLNLSGYG